MSSKTEQPQDRSPDSGSTSAQSDDEDEETLVGAKSEGESVDVKKEPVPPVSRKSTHKDSRVAGEHHSLTGNEVKQEKSASPSTKESRLPQSQQSFTQPLATSPFAQTSTASTTLSPEELPPWSHLSSEVRFFLEYHRNHITCYHYLWKYNANEFVHTTLIDLALSYEPLLYAVVAFAAFHHSIGQANGKLSDFLGFYNKSLSSLRKSLSASQSHSNGTILAVLQLAAFEVSSFQPRCFRGSLNNHVHRSIWGIGRIS